MAAKIRSSGAGFIIDEEDCPSWIAGPLEDTGTYGSSTYDSSQYRITGDDARNVLFAVDAYLERTFYSSSTGREEESFDKKRENIGDMFGEDTQSTWPFRTNPCIKELLGTKRIVWTDAILALASSFSSSVPNFDDSRDECLGKNKYWSTSALETIGFCFAPASLADLGWFPADVVQSFPEEIKFVAPSFGSFRSSDEHISPYEGLFMRSCYWMCGGVLAAEVLSRGIVSNPEDFSSAPIDSSISQFHDKLFGQDRDFNVSEENGCTRRLLDPATGDDEKVRNVLSPINQIMSLLDFVIFRIDACTDFLTKRTDYHGSYTWSGVYDSTMERCGGVCGGTWSFNFPKCIGENMLWNGPELQSSSVSSHIGCLMMQSKVTKGFDHGATIWAGTTPGGDSTVHVRLISPISCNVSLADLEQQIGQTQRGSACTFIVRATAAGSSARAVYYDVVLDESPYDVLLSNLQAGSVLDLEDVTEMPVELTARRGIILPGVRYDRTDRAALVKANLRFDDDKLAIRSGDRDHELHIGEYNILIADRKEVRGTPRSDGIYCKFGNRSPEGFTHDQIDNTFLEHYQELFDEIDAQTRMLTEFSESAPISYTDFQDALSLSLTRFTITDNTVTFISSPRTEISYRIQGVWLSACTFEITDVWVHDNSGERADEPLPGVCALNVGKIDINPPEYSPALSTDGEKRPNYQCDIVALSRALAGVKFNWNALRLDVNE